MDFFTGVFVRDMPRRGWVIFTGILGFVAGLIVLFQPAISLVTLAWVLGIWLIIYGTMEIVASFSVRKLAVGDGVALRRTGVAGRHSVGRSTATAATS